jgi:ribokinase
MKIAVIGSTMMDVVSYTDKIPEAGETRTATDFHTACGGKGANQAIAAAKLGADVLMLTCVGDDMFGRRALENFTQHNVDAKQVRVAAGVPNGVATILVDASSQNRILICKGANDHLTPAVIQDAAPDLEKCGLFVLQLEVPVETVYAAIDFAKKHGIKVLLNPAPAMKNLDMQKVCECDFFMPNETELAILTGMPTGTVADIKKAASQLLEHGLKNIIVTMGDKGSLWLSKGKEKLVPTLKVKAVDTTGAGDAFIGCFAEYYVACGDIEAAMERASLYAALSVTKKGTQDSYAEKAEFEEFVKKH